MQKQLSRQQKVKFLQELQAGKITIDQLGEQEFAIWYCNLNGNDFTYAGAVNGKPVNYTEEQYQAYRLKHPTQKQLVFRPCEGCDPLVDDGR